MKMSARNISGCLVTFVVILALLKQSDILHVVKLSSRGDIKKLLLVFFWFDFTALFLDLMTSFSLNRRPCLLGLPPARGLNSISKTHQISVSCKRKMHLEPSVKDAVEEETKHFMNKTSHEVLVCNNPHSFGHPLPFFNA